MPTLATWISSASSRRADGVTGQQAAEPGSEAGADDDRASRARRPRRRGRADRGRPRRRRWWTRPSCPGAGPAPPGRPGYRRAWPGGRRRPRGPGRRRPRPPSRAGRRPCGAGRDRRRPRPPCPPRRWRRAGGQPGPRWPRPPRRRSSTRRGAAPQPQDVRAPVAQVHDQRSSGPSSWRQPPSLGGVPPLPRTRNAAAKSPATPTASRTRRRRCMRSGRYPSDPESGTRRNRIRTVALRGRSAEPGVVGLVGIEPTTSPLSEARSNRLSYSPGDRTLYRGSGARITPYGAAGPGARLRHLRPGGRHHPPPFPQPLRPDVRGEGPHLGR